MISNMEKNVRVLEGYAVSEVRVPHSFVGKSIAEVQVRTRFGVDILTIKHAGHSHKAIEAIPSPDHVFLDDETLVVAGRTEDIERLKYTE